MEQKEKSISQFLNEAETLSDELVAAGHPISLADFIIYAFKVLRSDFKDLVTTLSARTEPIKFSELQTLLLSHEFIHNEALNKLTIVNTSTDPPPSAHIVQRGASYNHRGRGRSSRGCGRGRSQFFYSRSNYQSCAYETRPFESRCLTCHNHSAPYCPQRYFPQPNYHPSAHSVTYSPYPYVSTPTHQTSLNWF